MGLARHAIETFVTRGLTAAMGVAITILVARSLGPEGRGVFSAAMAMAAIGVQAGNLGLPSSNIYYASSNKRLIRTLIGNSLMIGFIGSGLLCLIAAGCFLLWPELAPLQGSILWISLLWVPIGIGLLLMQNLLLGMHHVRSFNMVELLKQAGTLIAICAAWVLGFNTPIEFFTASLLILFTAFIITTGYVIETDGNRPNVSFIVIREHARYGMKAYLATFFAFLVLRIDLLMIQYIQGEESTGLYSVAVALADVLYLAPIALGTVLFPRLSAMQDRNQQWQLVIRAVGWMTLILSLLSGLLMLGSEWLLDLLFGEAYLPALPAILILIPSVALLGINTIFMNYFAALGMPMFTVISPGLATAINIPANYYLIPNFGIEGAAWASLGSYCFMLLLSLGYVWLLKKKRLEAENE